MTCGISMLVVIVRDLATHKAAKVPFGRDDSEVPNNVASHCEVVAELLIYERLRNKSFGELYLELRRVSGIRCGPGEFCNSVEPRTLSSNRLGAVRIDIFDERHLRILRRSVSIESNSFIHSSQPINFVNISCGNAIGIISGRGRGDRGSSGDGGFVYVIVSANVRPWVSVSDIPIVGG